jgi:two-component sensor histidine kinase
MALVHEKLYQSDDLAWVDFADYLRELTENIVASFSPSASEIRFTLEADEIRLAIDAAIPCGLIINELVSNAYKHAFPDGRTGAVNVALKRRSPGFIVMRVADTGRGIPLGLDLRRTESLGMQLVFTLAQQIQGEIEIKSSPGEGTVFELTVPEISSPEIHPGRA